METTLPRSQRWQRQQKYQDVLRTLTLFKVSANTNIERAIDLALLMEEEQKYDCLYNKFSKEYRDKYKKISCWKAIGEKFDVLNMSYLRRRLLRRKTPIITRKHTSSRSRRFIAVMLILRNRASYVVTPRSPRSSFSDRSAHREPFLSAIVAIMWKPGFSYTFYRGNVVGVLVHFFSLPLISPCIGAASISHFVNAAAKFSCCSSNKKMSPLFFISRSRSLSPFFSLSFAGLPPTFSFSLSFSCSIIQICRHDN